MELAAVVVTMVVGTEVVGALVVVGVGLIETVVVGVGLIVVVLVGVTVVLLLMAASGLKVQMSKLSSTSDVGS